MLKQRVKDKVRKVMTITSEFENLDIPDITFDVRGSCAGICRIKHGKCTLRFNLKLLEENTEDFLHFTVPHEVAHYISRKLFGSISPHGKEWKTIMKLFGIEKPLRCHNFDVTSANPWEYKCNCRTHYLSNRHHVLAESGKHYVCKGCKSFLKFIGRNNHV